MATARWQFTVVRKQVLPQAETSIDILARRGQLGMHRIVVPLDPQKWVKQATGVHFDRRGSIMSFIHGLQWFGHSVDVYDLRVGRHQVNYGVYPVDRLYLRTVPWFLGAVFASNPATGLSSLKKKLKKNLPRYNERFQVLYDTACYYADTTAVNGQSFQLWRNETYTEPEVTIVTKKRFMPVA